MIRANPLSGAPLRAALLLLTTATPLAAHCETTEAPTLPAIQVTAERGGPAALVPSAAQERERLSVIAGASSVSAMSEETRMGTLRDAMSYQPGVVLQDFSGGIDQPRFNIRGSGIQSNPISRGVLLLQDGLPLNEADGSFIIGTLEPRDAAWFSVLRGANARNPAANALGGEVNFRSLTGRDESGRVRLETGSFGRRGGQVALGGDDGRLDGRVSVSGDDFDGYRHHSGSRRRALRANAGIRLENGMENRTYLSYTDLRFDIPFVVPQDTVTRRPRDVMGDGDTLQDRQMNVYQRDPWRHVEQWRIANLTSWYVGNTAQTLGLYYQETDDRFKNLLVDTPTHTRTEGVQWSLESDWRGTEYRLMLAADHSDMDREFYPVSPTNGGRLARFGNYGLEASNFNAGLDVARDLGGGFRLDSALRFTFARRDAQDRGTGQSLDQDWSWISPKIGATWASSPQTTWFANLSWQREVPGFWEIVSSDVAAANPAVNSSAMNRLGTQRARSLEIGGRGRLDSRMQWDVALYRSEIRDELLAVTDASGIRIGTYNYEGRTRHQGVELGLSGTWSPLSWRLAWTYSDFRFRDGVLAGKRVAGVPEHLINAELMYRIGAWQFGANLYWSPQDAPVDHVNTPGLEQRRYALLGLKAIYRPTTKWTLYAQVDNLMDRHYASSFVTRYQATAAQPTYTSGIGRSISAGVAYTF